MKRTVLAFVMTALLTSLCAVPASSQLLSEKTSKKAPDMPKFYVELDEMVHARASFEAALYKDDAQTIKALVEKYPTMNFLRTKMKYVDPYGLRGSTGYPICIASDYGNTKIMKYMAEKDPTLMSIKCNSYNEDAPLDQLVQSRPESNEILWFLSHGFKVQEYILAEIASRDLDIKTWKKLIPALLDGGAKPYAKTDIGSGKGDALYRAALSKKENVIVALRDELKKRNIPAVAHYTFIQCPGSWGEAPTEAKYLEEHGIPLEVDHIIVYRDCD